MPVVEIFSLAWFLNKAWLLLVGYVLYVKKVNDQECKERDKIIADLVTANTKAELKYITESRMKEAIREELEPYRDAQQEIKLLLRSLNIEMSTLSTEMAVQNALHNQNKED